MKKTLISATLAVLLAGNLAFGEVNKTNAQISKDVAKTALTNATNKANKNKSDVKVVKEAVNAIKLTQEALIDLSKNKKDDAIKKIEDALGKLEVILQNPKAPALIPLDAKVAVYEYRGSNDSITNAIISSIALLQNKRVQAAREIVSTLRDEIDFITVNLPMASYPAALKLAAKKLHENKVDEAKAILATALNTFVQVDVVTPIGILEAQELIKAASKVAKKDKKLALSHLEAAKEALRRDELLGYTSKSDTTYKMLRDEINKVQKEIRGKNKAEKLFEELINKIKEFKDKAAKTIKG